MSEGAILAGQQYEPGKDRTFRFTEQAKDYTGANDARVTGSEGAAATDITPLDRAAAKVRTYNLAAIVALLEAEAFVTPIKLVLSDLPDVLTAVTVTHNNQKGNGAANYPVSQQDFLITGSGSGSLSPRASAQASVAILPSIVPTINDSYRRRKVNGRVVVFNVAADVVTIATILTRLGTILSVSVTDLPVFKPVQVALAAMGQQFSVQQKASSTASASVSGTSNTVAYEYGDEYSKEVGLSEKVEIIPPTIHGSITISDPTGSQQATVTVAANTKAISGAAAIGAITNEPTPITVTAESTVAPASISATSPASIPSTGTYLVDVAGQQDDFGVTQIRAIVVDFTQYA